ncbi:hypothetical protein HaLaN_12471 [Haematococcus lacustris]|uniref:Uncharacterized protein n=1 Tax=Haematococcus lacustris TaxID=44745 RepID=A0A699ZK29_HAELA|nr:hypothetical protein HaLaN_12471 [Haematococcus lacustris]
MAALRADLHDHIIAVSAANELAQLKEQLIVAQARLAHQASGAEQLQQSVVRLTTAVSIAGAAANPHGAQGGAATKPVQAAKQTSQARKVLRAMQRITLPVKLPTREEYSSAASARDQNTARQQRQADITNKLQQLEDTARQKGITLSQLKQFCVRLNLATKGAKSRIQCLEAISQHQQKQHQQARAVATITPSKRHAPDSVMRMR